MPIFSFHNYWTLVFEDLVEILSSVARYFFDEKPTFSLVSKEQKELTTKATMDNTKSITKFHTNKALELSLEGHFEEALEHMEIATKHSHSMSVLQNIGKIYLRKKDYDNSIASLEKALALGRVTQSEPNELAEVELDLSEAKAKKGSIEEAKKHFRNYLNYSDKKLRNVNIEEEHKGQLNEAELLFATGNWLIQTGCCREAIECLQNSLAIHNQIQKYPELANKSLLALANAYMTWDKLDSARQYYTNYAQMKVLQDCPQLELVDDLTRNNLISAEVENMIGNWYSSVAKDYNKAKYHYTKATNIRGSWFEPHYNLATQFFLNGEYKICVKKCKVLIKTSNKLSLTNVELGLVSALAGSSHAELGNVKRAVLLFRDAIQKNPQSDEFKKKLSQLELKLVGLRLHKKGFYLDAIQFYNKSLELNQADCQLYFNIGRCYQKLNNLSEAARYFQRAMDCDKIKFVQLNSRLTRRKWLSLFKRSRF